MPFKPSLKTAFQAAFLHAFRPTSYQTISKPSQTTRAFTASS
jgi:hypothetical protein